MTSSPAAFFEPPDRGFGRRKAHVQIFIANIAIARRHLCEREHPRDVRNEIVPLISQQLADNIDNVAERERGCRHARSGAVKRGLTIAGGLLALERALDLTMIIGHESSSEQQPTI